MNTSPNQPAAPNAGLASQQTIGQHWPGVGEPGRSARKLTPDGNHLETR
jgi:hypothetical protein